MRLQPPDRFRARAALVLTLAATACAPERPRPVRPAPAAAPEPALPPIPFRDGPLVLDVVHPEEGATLAVRDSTFIFGSTGSGRAALAINGVPVPVEPNGAFLAFFPVPPDGVYRLTAKKAEQMAELVRHVVLPPPPPTLPPGVAAILEETIYPRGAWVALPGERIEVGFRGSPGGTAALVLPRGIRIPLVETAIVEEEAAGEAFQRGPEPSDGRAVRRVSEYRGYFSATALAAADTTVQRPTLVPVPVEPPDDGRTMPEDAAAAAAAGEVEAAERANPAPDTVAHAVRPRARLELVVGADTARAPLPLNLALLDPDRPRVAETFDPSEPPRAASGEVRGRPGPGFVYHYFWPDRTRLAIAGERDGQYRVRLTEDLSAWVSADELRLLPPGTPPPASRVGTVRMRPAHRWIDVRFNLDERIPFRVDERERALVVTLYGGTGDTNWLQYGGIDPLIERAEWSQPEDERYRFTLHLAEPPWGYRVFWGGNGDLVLRVRRPPTVDRGRPLRGLLIALDPGHPPSGAVGPTRLTEAEANLAIALALRPLLEEAGARVLMTRTENVPVDLYARTRLATEADADIFVSIHNNAFPDGVNPFVNNGTSTYYFFPQSIDLARALQVRLLRELRLRDLGIGRGDLAPVRHPWMPAALTESMFLMIPRQEAALRDPDVIERIARAHRDALVDFLRGRARRR